MTYVYYNPPEETIYFTDHKVDDHGSLLGTVTALPRRPAFIVHSLLDNAGYHDVTGLTFVHGERQTVSPE